MSQPSRTLSELVPDQRVEMAAEGFGFTEGPLWLADQRRLLFTDIPNHKIYLYDPASGDVELFRDHPGGPNGTALDLEGRLIVCEQGARTISRMNDRGEFEVVASRYHGRRVNSPNDLYVAPDGSIYFTDPPFGLDPRERELEFNGIFRMDPDGGLTLLDDTLDRPNGIDFSPDGGTAYVIDTTMRSIVAFGVLQDGTFGPGWLFADLRSPIPGAPDGLAIDLEGNIYSSGAGGVWVFTPDGEHLGTVPVPDTPVNLAWGDDGKAVYITQKGRIYRLRTSVGGW